MKRTDSQLITFCLSALIHLNFAFMQSTAPCAKTNQENSISWEPKDNILRQMKQE